MSASARKIKSNRLKSKSLKSNTLRLSLPKPRNPLVAKAAVRKAGSHGKSTKAARRAEAVQLRQNLSGDAL